MQNHRFLIHIDHRLFLRKPGMRPKEASFATSLPLGGTKAPSETESRQQTVAVHVPAHLPSESKWGESLQERAQCCSSSARLSSFLHENRGFAHLL